MTHATQGIGFLRGADTKVRPETPASGRDTREESRLRGNPMHPCREYWGQDVAYGSLVNDERLRRVDRVCALPEIYVLDIDADVPPEGTDADADPARSAHLAGLVKRLCGFDGREETL